MRYALWTILFAIATAMPAGAGVLSDFGPFPDSETVNRVPLKPCTLIRSTQTDNRIVEEIAMTGEEEKPFLTVTVDHPSSERWVSLLKMDFGKKQPSYEGSLEGAKAFGEVLTADLNGDLKPDFIIPYTLHRGQKVEEDVPGDMECVLFALSGKEQYRFTNAKDVEFDEAGFLSLLNDGAVQWVHTAFLTKHPAKSKYPDRKIYFYLHRLFYIRGDQLTAVEGMDARLPKFVLYTPGTSRRNHKETKLLTEAQKADLLAANPPQVEEWAVKVTVPKPAVRKPVRKAGRR